MKKLPITSAIGILMFIAGHYWVNEASRAVSALIVFPAFLTVIFIVSSCIVLVDADI